MGKKGQFFTMDAFIALLVIAAGLMLVFSINAYKPSPVQPQVISQDFVNSLSQTKIREINNVFVRQQIEGGNITNTDNSLLQQAYEFKRYFDSTPEGSYDPLSKSNLSAEFLESVSGKLIAEQFSFRIFIDGDKIHGRGNENPGTNLLVSSKQIVFGVINKSTEFWGPAAVEVRIWQ